MFERFTASARQVVVLAVDEARSLGHGWVGTEHLLLGLLAEGEGIAAAALAAEGVTLDGARAGLDALLRPGAATDAAALAAIGIDLPAVRARVEEAFGPGALDRAAHRAPRRRGRRRRRVTCADRRGLGLAPRAKKVCELALREALHLGHGHIGTEHLLLGLLREGSGLGARMLADAGVSFDRLRARVLADAA